MRDDRNLRVAILAREHGLITDEQLDEIREGGPAIDSPSMAGWLLEWGWIDAAGRARLEGVIGQLMPDLDEGCEAPSTLPFAATGIEGALAANGTAGPFAERTLAAEDIEPPPPSRASRAATMPMTAEMPPPRTTLADGPRGDTEPLDSTEAEAPEEISTIAATPPEFERLERIDLDFGEARTRYSITHLHAKGGIGQVWLARDEEFGREVALKELRRDRQINASIEARFVAEARITGQLEHPGIVPVYELRDRPEDRRPYYTMRFVRGRTLSRAAQDYHDRRKAGRASPLELATLLNAFVGVCNAVAYAHSRGVIHRDLKGHNIILGEFGEAMVLDWGLAKTIGQPDGDADAAHPPVTLADPESCGQTIEGRALGTPAYMSPEQAEGRRDRIGPPSDVYGLGAILFEILTGRPPFEGPNGTEVLRRVVHEPPPRPRAINPSAPPALEAVCLRALSKEPADRYPSATALAEELRRWLADEPVEAYREPWLDRLARWSKRHRTAVASAASLLLTALVALAVGTALVRRERDEARTQRAVARQAVDDMYTDVAETWLGDRLDPLQERFLKKALDYYERFAAEDSAGPAPRRERGRAYQRLGDVYRKLGRRDEAARALRRSEEIFGRLAVESPDDHGPRDDLAETRRRLGLLMVDRGDYEAARGLYESALADRERLAAAEGTDRPEYRLRLARILKNRGDLRRLRGDLMGGESDYDRARETLEGLGQAPAARQDLAVVCDALGMLLKERGRVSAAEAAFRRALGLQEALVAESPTSPPLREALGKTCNSLALLLSRTGPSDEEERCLRRQLAIFDRLAADFPGRPEYRRELARSHVNLGLMLYGRGDYGEAEPILRRAIELNDALAKAEPAVVQYRLDLGKCHFDLGRLLQATGRLPEAESSMRAALAIYEKLYAEQPGAPRNRFALAGALLGLGDVTSPADPGKADPLYDRAIDHLDALVAKHPDNDEYRIELAKCLNNRGIALAGLPGKKDEAEASYRRAEEQDRILLKKAPEVREYRRALAACLNNRGELRRPEAEAAYREAIALTEGPRGGAPGDRDGRSDLAAFRNNLGECLAGLDGRRPEAITEFRMAANQFEALANDFPKEVAYHSLEGYTLENLGRLLLEMGRPTDARLALERAVEHQRAAVASDRRNAAYRGRLGTHLAALAKADMALGLHDRAAHIAFELPRVAPSRPRGCYDAARLLARCVPLAEQDGKLPADRRELTARSYGHCSLAMLREAIDADRQAARDAAAEADFAPLRPRDEFRSLLEEADGAAPTESE